MCCSAYPFKCARGSYVARHTIITLRCLRVWIWNGHLKCHKFDGKRSDEFSLPSPVGFCGNWKRQNNRRPCMTPVSCYPSNISFEILQPCLKASPSLHFNKERDFDPKWAFRWEERYSNLQINDEIWTLVISIRAVRVRCELDRCMPLSLS